VARACGLATRRVQFTPDLLPSDLTGGLTLYEGRLQFRPGPVFTNILLADEINRTPPKTQAALLEAMQEGQVSADGAAHQLPTPFVVLATQNPIEFEGTYPLPEAQVDRFLMKVPVSYPSAQDEERLLRLGRSGITPATLSGITAVADARVFAAMRAEADAVAVTDPIVSYVAALVRRTRELPSVSLGASPRAGVHLLAASKAWAALSGRTYVVPDDVVALAIPVLAHRLVLTAEAELDRFGPEQAVRAALSGVPVPR
jgi:MoxR-like ATPase